MSSENISNQKPTPVGWKPVPSGRTRLEAIDGVRALAMLMVYTYHVWQFGESPTLRVGRFSIGPTIGQFPSGVDLFMVLSGFCLFWPFANKPRNLDNWSVSDYALRRIRRIMPPYYAAIAFVILQPFVLKLLFKAAGKTVNAVVWPSALQIITHLTLTHTLFPGTWDGLQGAFWSLGLEAQFYLVFPLVIFGVKKWGAIRIATLMILMSIIYRIIAAAVIGDRPFPANFLPSIVFIGRWMQFAAGMIAAQMVAGQLRQSRRLPAWYGSATAGMAVLLFAAAGSLWVQQFELFPGRDLLLAIAYAVGIFGLCATHCWINFFFENRVVAGLGFMSYSIFLLHQNTVYYFGEILKKFFHLSGVARFSLMMTVGFAGIVLLSYIFFLIFEKPFLNKKPRSKNVDHPAVMPAPIASSLFSPLGAE